MQAFEADWRMTTRVKGGVRIERTHVKTDTGKAAIQQWDGSWLLKRERERGPLKERERTRNGGVVLEREEGKRVKASTRQNINLYVNGNKAGGLEAASAVMLSGVAIRLREVVFPINWGSVQIEKWNPRKARNAGCQAQCWAGRRSLTPPPRRLHLWKKAEEQKRPERKEMVAARDEWAVSLFITSIHKIIASHYHSYVEVFSPIRGGRVPLTAEA